MKIIRTVLGSLLIVAGIVLTILPGSTLFILAGLVLISIDYKYPRKFLGKVQKSASKASRKMDSFLLSRKYR